MDIKVLATKLYNLSCDLDFMDYNENRQEEIQLLYNALETIKDYSDLNSSANRHFLTLYSCLEKIASTN